jgi:PKD repeat protein
MKHFNFRKSLRFLFLFALLGISTLTFTNQSTAPAGSTNAPSEGTCTGCHSGSAISSGTAHASITLTGLPAGGYSPGVTYNLTFSAQSAATSKNGFQVTALNASNTMAGSFTAGTGSQSQMGSGRTYIGHNVSGTSQNQWSFSWTAPNPAVGTVTFYTALNATNANSATSGDAVYVKTFTASSGNLPVATITSPANNAIFCVGDTVQFTGTATNSPISYAWDFLGNSPNASTQQNPKIVMNSVGFRTVRFRATNSAGTSANAQITLQVVAKPTATISGKNIICGNDSVTLTANSGTGFTYLWQPGNLSTQSIKVGSAGNYTVRVSNGANCSVTSTPFVVISGGSKPLASLTLSSDTICSSDSVLLTASSGLNAYVFYRNGLVIDSTAQNQKWVKGLTANTILGVKAYTGICASDMAEKLVQVNIKPAAPAINCGPFTSSSVSFNIVGLNTQISIDSGKTWLTPNQGNVHFISGLSPNTSVTLWARRQVSFPCLYTVVSDKTCAAANCAPLTLSITAPKNICQGAPLSDKMMRVVSTNAIRPFYNFEYPKPFLGSNWTKQDSFPANITITGPFVFKIAVIDSSNALCPIKDTSFTINFVNFPGGPPMLTFNKSNYCVGDSISFLVNNANSIVNKYKYYKVDGANRIEFASKIKPNYNVGPMPLSPNFVNGTSVIAQAIDTVSGCGIFSNTRAINVEALPNLGFTYTKTNLQIVLTDTSNSTVTRDWYMEGDSFPSNQRVFNYTFKNAGLNTIKMKGVSNFGCVNVVEKTVQITATGLANLNNEIGLEVFPNPNSGSFTLRFNSTAPAQVTLYNLHGQLVYQTEQYANELVQLNPLTPGVYLLKVEVNNKIVVQKMVIE